MILIDSWNYTNNTKSGNNAELFFKKNAPTRIHEGILKHLILHIYDDRFQSKREESY